MVRLEPHNAELLIKIYDLRREEKLRKGRAWLLASFWAEDLKGFLEICPLGSETNAHYRQVITYWDMVAAIVNRGMIDEDLYFETNLEGMLTWIRVKKVVAAFRETRKNPLYVRNLELMAERQQIWFEQRAPGALEATLKGMEAARAHAAEKK
ncbi:MAG: hypothetical protein EXQ56_07315 [Acidobacteria bacterium]|nr:hypothetical protein [Acidobacteriota bacterium]